MIYQRHGQDRSSCFSGGGTVGNSISPDAPDPATLFFLFVLGAIAGSFVATLAKDWFNGPANWAFRRSRCESCGTRLNAFELIPVLSWLRFKGRCRYCGGRIGPLPLAAEILAGLALAVPALALDRVDAAFVAGAGMLLLLLALIDLHHWRLPHLVTLAFAALGLAKIAFLSTSPGLPQMIAAALVNAAAIWFFLSIFRKFYRWLRRRDGLGGGDIMLMAAAACWLDPSSLFLAFAAAATIGIVVAFLTSQKIEAETALPFGPPLALALWFLIVAGERLHG